MPTLWDNWGKKFRALSTAAVPSLGYAEYRKGLSARLRPVQVPGHLAALDLKQLFVPPQFLPLIEPGASLPVKQPDYQSVLRLSRRLLLLGQPGIGKSTYLKMLAVLLAEEEMPKPLLHLLTLDRPGGPLDHLVPLFVSLPEFADSAQELTGHLVQVMARYGFENAHNFLTDKLRGGECLLLLDELDKVSPEDKLQQVETHIERLVTEFPDNRFIVTTRLDELKALLPSFTSHVRLLGIAENQVPLFVQKYSGDRPCQPESFLAAVERSQSLRSLATNPWFCAALAAAHGQEDQTPMCYPRLLQEAVRVLLGVNTLPVSVPTTETVLQELALRLHTARQNRFSHDDFSSVAAEVVVATGEGDASGETRGTDLIEALLEPARLICGTADGSYTFTYPALQGHFTARALVARGQTRALLEHLGDPWWEEVIVQTAGLQDDASSLVVDLLQAGEQSVDSLLLAGRCLAESSQVEAGLRDCVLDGLLGIFQHEEPDRWPAAALAVAGLVGQDVEKSFLTLARDWCPERREQAMWALGRIAARWTIQPLTAALLDTAWPVRRRAAWALSRIRDERAVQLAVQPLIGLLDDEVATLQLQAVETLGAIGESAVLPLIRSLDHPKERVRSMAVAALVQIGTPAIGLLIEALGDREENVRKGAIEVLARIGESAIDSLKAAIKKDEKVSVVKSAAEVLGRIGSERAAKALIALLETADPGARRDAINALVVVGKPAVKPLIGALEDDRAEVRRWAAQALHRIGDLAIGDLIEVLGDERWQTRTEAAEVIEQFGISAAAYLIATLDSARPEARFKAAELLGRLGDEEAVEPLIGRLHDEEATVRVKAIEALGQIGDKRALRPLIDSLRDDHDTGARAKAAEVFGQIGDEQAVQLLIQALTDREDAVRLSAATGLRRLGELAVEPLIAALYNHTFDSHIQIKIAEGILEEIGTVRAEGRDHSLMDLARIYHELLTQDYSREESFERAIRLLSQLRWWKHWPEFYESFRTADEFRRYQTPHEIAEGEDRLHWMTEVTTWLRPDVKEVFLELSKVSRDVREGLSSLSRENRIYALLSARRRLNQLRELDRKLPERNLFESVIESWRGAIVKTIRRWGFGADLALEMQTKRVRYRDNRPITCVLLVKNIGSSSARNLYIELKTEGKSKLKIDKSAGHPIPELPTRAERSLEFSFEPPGVGEVELQFETRWDDETGESYHVEFPCSIEVFKEIRKYKLVTNNPYNPTKPVKSREGFFGREPELDDLRQKIKDMGYKTPGGFILLIGIRRVGKTSLLYILREKLSSEGYVCPFVDLQGLSDVSTKPDEPHVFYRIAEEICMYLASQGVSVDPPKKESYAVDPGRSFLDLRKELDAVASDAKPLILMIDEFDTMVKLVEDEKVGRRIFDYLRSWIQHSQRIVCILVGTPGMRKQYRKYETDLFVNAIPHRLDVFTRAEAEKMIVEPMRGELEYDPSAIDKILDLTAKHPFFITHMCRGLINLARDEQINSLDLTDVNRYVLDLLGTVEETLAYYTQHLEAEAKRAIAALAESTDEYSPWASLLELHRTLGRVGVPISREELINGLEQLKEHELVEVGSEGYRVRFPLHSMWLHQTRQLEKL